MNPRLRLVLLLGCLAISALEGPTAARMAVRGWSDPAAKRPALSDPPAGVSAGVVAPAARRRSPAQGRPLAGRGAVDWLAAR